MSGAGVRSFADLHCHSSASFDSLAPAGAMMRAAVARGLTHLAITDHDRVDGALAARDSAPEELTVIVGQEVRTSGGDMIGLFLERPVRAGMTPLETSRAIREQGGLVGLPHPFDRFRGSGAWGRSTAELAALAEAIDYVEGWNARIMIGPGNELAMEFAVTHGLPAVAASDSHSVMEVGVAYTSFPRRVDTANEMRDALRDAELITGRASRLLRAGMPVNKLVQRLRGYRRQSAS